MTLAIAGCAFDSGVFPVAPGIYGLSEMRAPAEGGGAEARRSVLVASNAFCHQQNRVALTLSLRPDGDPFTPYYPTAFDATFRCVPPSEPGAMSSSTPGS